MMDADPKTIQQINFTGNLTKAEGARMYLLNNQKKQFQIFQKEQLKYHDFFSF